MDFVSNQSPQIADMLKEIGVSSVEELFSAIPSHLRHFEPLVQDGLSEAEVVREMESIASRNNFINRDSFLGAGAYAHYIPALVGAITSRSEFLTSYTPYQPEISQGVLQASFEFQSAISALTALPVAGAGVYDGASATAEAALMALRLKKGKKRIAISNALHPSYEAAVRLYLSGLKVEIDTIETAIGKQIDSESFKKALGEDTAGVIVQSPNFFGTIENMRELAHLAKEKEVLFIACGNPLFYALFDPPGEYGADIAVGDCQPFGLPLQYGGPYAGYMACQEPYIRQLPGRLVGETVDINGKRGFVLILQTREQHIRREKATSNICTNQALATLASLITLLWYGPKGLPALALTNYRRAHYLAENLEKIPGIRIWKPFFNEFTVEFSEPMETFFKRFRSNGIEPGLPLNRFYSHLNRHVLVAVTELKTVEQLNRYIETAKPV